MKKLTIGALSAATMAMCGIGVAHAQQAQMRQRTLPPPNPGMNLEQGQLPQGHERTTCKAVQVFVTLRGVAFACADYQENIRYTVVIDSSQYAGLDQAAMPFLIEAAKESRGYILDPQKTNQATALHVRHRQASQKSYGVCQLVSPSITRANCREMIHLYK